MIFTYNYAPPGTVTNNFSVTQKASLTARDCSSDSYLNGCPPGWNDTLCGNDEAYCQPFERGDMLCHQFRFNMLRYTALEFYYVNCQATINPEQPLNAAWYTYQQASLGRGQGYVQNICIDTSLLPEDLKCFYIVVKVTGCEEPPEPGVECRDPVVLGSYCTEQYCEVRCNQKTITLQGTYTNRDCFGNYYGLLPGNVANIYQPQFRIPGEIYADGYSYEETIVGDLRTAMDLREKYVVLIGKIPPYVAQQIAQAIGGQRRYIDGVEYVAISGLEKNYQEGRSWIPVLTAYRECDNNFTCV
jgi:hypothetical protein